MRGGVDFCDTCRYYYDSVQNDDFGGIMHLSLLAELLGGEKTLGHDLKTQMDLVYLSRNGIPKTSLLCLAEYINSPISQLAELLPVTERTIQRYAPSKHFNKVISEYILRLANVIARGVEVFEDKESFLIWLTLPSTALGGQTPMDLLSSSFGSEMICDELTRIEYGVIS